jgi:GNAT superfamily N-acetyltransferase
MMIVREVRPDDAKEVMKVGKKLHMESPFHSRYKWDKGNAFRFIRDLSSSDDSCMYICTNGSGEITGMVGGQIHSMYYTNDKYASEAIFYVLPEHRGGRSAILLLKEFEKWAKKHNVKDMEFGVVTAIHPEKTDRFFKKYGFEYLGANFYKEIK